MAVDGGTEYGNGARIFGSAKKSRKGLIPWLKKYGGKPPVIVMKHLQAKKLNQILGGQFFNAWDIDQLPEEDLKDIESWVKLSAQINNIMKKE